MADINVQELFSKEEDSKRKVLEKDMSTVRSTKDSSDITNQTSDNAIQGSVIDKSSSNSQEIDKNDTSPVENGAISKTAENIDNDDVDIEVERDLNRDGERSGETADMEDKSSNSKSEKDTKNEAVVKKAQREVRIIKKSKTVVEKHIERKRISNTRVTTKNGNSTRFSPKDIGNNDVEINKEDHFENYEFSSKERELHKNKMTTVKTSTDAEFLNTQQEHCKDQEGIVGIPFEKTMSESDAVTEEALSPKEFTQIEIYKDLENEGDTSVNWVQIESNLDYAGKDASGDDLKTEGEIQQIAEMPVETSVDGIIHFNSNEIIEDGMSSNECKDVENVIPSVEFKSDSENDDLNDRREDERVENNMGENDIDKDGDMYKVVFTESDPVEHGTVDFGDVMNSDLVNMQLQHEKEMQELRTTLQDEYQKQVLKISDELREYYQSDMDEKIAKHEEEWEQEFTKQKREFDEQVSAVQREQSMQCQEAIERVTLDAEDQLKNMKYSYERETAEHKQRIRELLEREALWEMKEKELSNEKSRNESENLGKIKKLENQLSFEREEVELQLNGAKDEVKSLKKQHQNEMENLTAELEKKYTIIVEEMRTELKSKYQDEMDRKVNQVESHLREQYEQDLEKTKEEVQESTSTLKTKHEKQVTEILTQLEELHERNQQHELQEARLKENFEAERKRVCELTKKVEEKTKIVRELQRNKKDLKLLHEEFKQYKNEKSSFEEKLKEYSKSLAKETICQAWKELGGNSEVIEEVEGLKKDPGSEFEEELQRRLKSVTEEKDSLEKKLNEDLKSEKLNVKALRRKLEIKDEEIKRLQEKEAEIKKLEDEFAKLVQEKVSLEQALKQTQKKEAERLQEDQMSANLMNHEEYKNLKTKVNNLTNDKHSLEQKLADSLSEINSLREKLRGDENIAGELKSNYDTKILQVKQNFKEEINALEIELKRVKNSEEESLGLRQDVSRLKTEISTLNEELRKHQATISELEDTGRCRELEIANLILSSPSPQGLKEQEFDFSENALKRTEQLESELARYKKKVEELEEEAEDKFETTLCSNCQGLEKSDDILHQTKALVDKIQLDCQKKVQSVTKDLEKMENVLLEQVKECESLNAKLIKAEEDLTEERKRSLELSKLGKQVDMNCNVLGHEETAQDRADLKGEATKDDDQDNESALPNSKDFKSLFEEQEKFYKSEILKKDEEIFQLMRKNEKIQMQVQDEKAKLDERKLQYEELKLRTLEQKTKYESEVNLMQNEIKMLIQDNNEVKDQLELLQNVRKEKEKFQTKFQESENAVQAKFLEIEVLQAKLLETENILREISSKHKQEVLTLEEIIREKEKCIADLRNSLEFLETSRERLELDLSNQKQLFSERERDFLDEIQEMKSVLERGNTKSSASSLPENGESMKRSDSLEMLIHEDNFDSSRWNADKTPWQLGGYRGVDRDNFSEGIVDIRQYEGVERENFTDGQIGEVRGKLMDARSHEGIDWDNIFQERADNRDTNEYDGISPLNSRSETRNNVPKPLNNRVRSTEMEMQPGSEIVQYEEIDYSPLDDFKIKKEALSDNYEAIPQRAQERIRTWKKHEDTEQRNEIPWDTRHEVLKNPYPELNNAEFESSPDGLFPEEKYKEIGCDESLELLKYEHEIDLMLERKENDRLRAEIETLSNCVDVFHSECDALKRSLDNTLNVVEILRDERDGLMKEQDLNMAEHSELVMDLIKCDETINRLEEGNEKLQNDRRLLEECLMEKQGILPQKSLANNENKMSYNPKLRTRHPFQDGGLENGKDTTQLLRKSIEHEKNESDRLKKNREDLRSGTKFLRNESEQYHGNKNGFSRIGNEYRREENGIPRKAKDFNRNEVEFPGIENEFPRSDVGNLRSMLLEDLVREAKLEKRNPAVQEREDLPRSLITSAEFLQAERRSIDDFGVFPPERTGDMKTEERFPKQNKMPREEQEFAKDFASTSSSGRDGKDYNGIHAVDDGTGYHFTSSSNRRSILNHSKQSSKKSDSKHNNPEETRSYSSYYRSIQSPVLNMSASQQPITENSSRATKKSGKPKLKTSLPSSGRNSTPSARIVQHKKSRKSNSRNFSPRSSRVSGIHQSNTSFSDSQNVSNSRILTSTRTYSTTDRLVPNLSGLSPIVSPLDRHYHAQRARWQRSEEERNDTSRNDTTIHEDTTFLLNVDPNMLLQTSKNGPSSRSFKTRTRSRSADDRFLAQSGEVTRDVYSQKPLVINFEDFVYRHQVKSSEQVANIRDPSPAELWFS